MIGLSALLRPFLPYLLAGVAALGLVGAIYQTGKNAARRQCDVASLKAEIANLRADISIAAKAEADAKTKSDNLERAAAQAREKLDAFEKEIAKRPVGERCMLSRGDVERLRSIR